uniref:Uncharacterized protein n=1 Tax=Cacopsylla melanoneura TaxID=428564 RepID=A0A8D9FGU3_9HEMI
MTHGQYGHIPFIWNPLTIHQNTVMQVDWFVIRCYVSNPQLISLGANTIWNPCRVVNCHLSSFFYYKRLLLLSSSPSNGSLLFPYHSYPCSSIGNTLLYVVTILFIQSFPFILFLFLPLCFF